jgi:hypothetical protein
MNIGGNIYLLKKSNRAFRDCSEKTQKHMKNKEKLDIF